jgi:hypothetical protein
MDNDSFKVRDFVLAQNGLSHITLPSDTELLRRFCKNAGFDGPRHPRWSIVGSILGHGSGVSWAICKALGLDPDEYVGSEEYREDSQNNEPVEPFV